MSEFSIPTGANGLRVTTVSNGSHTVAWSVGTWRWDAFADELANQLTSAINGTWAVEVFGVDVDDATKADGLFRISWTLEDSDSHTLAWSNAASTIDPRLLGYSKDQTADVTAATGPFLPPFVPRHNWYPGARLESDLEFRLFFGRWRETSAGIIRGHNWSQTFAVQLVACNVEAALVRVEAGENADNAARALLAVDDENAALEVFFEDILSTEADWHYGRSTSSPADTRGPYKLLVEGDHRVLPASPPTQLERKGPERWRVQIPGELSENFTGPLTYAELVLTTGMSEGETKTVVEGATYVWRGAISYWLRSEADALRDSDLAEVRRIDGDVVPASESPTWTDSTQAGGTITVVNQDGFDWVKWSGVGASARAKSEFTLSPTNVRIMWQGYLVMDSIGTVDNEVARVLRAKNSDRRINFNPAHGANSDKARLVNSSNAAVGTVNEEVDFVGITHFVEVIADTLGDVEVYIDNQATPSLTAAYTSFTADAGGTWRFGDEGDASPNFDVAFRMREVKCYRLT